jgi:small subunit ribosomal protein S20
LANSASARKRANQAEQRRQEAYKKVVPVLDSSATHGLISHNKAARHKSRMHAQIKAL